MSAKDLEVVQNILKKYLIDCEVWAFGSRVTGESRKFSDLDLLIISENKIDLRTLGEIGEEFADSDLTFRVDLIDNNSITESFRKLISINKERIL